MTVRILVVDNYDSFVFNLVQYLCQLGADCDVLRNDEVSLDAVGSYHGVLISPGPGIPEKAGVSVPLIERWAGEVPILGVCLGHQAIGVAFGGTVGRAPELLHGKTSQVWHEQAGILRDLPSPFTATRYHSLCVDATSLPEELEVTGRTGSGVIMALRHKDLPVEGVQFHPESVLTEHGHRMLANWLVQCGDPSAPARAASLASLTVAG